MEPGVHDLTGDLYHADPCDTPSLSASIAHILLTSSPLHAWHAHPPLNPDWAYEPDDKFDLGTAAHAFILEGSEADVEVVDADSWRTKDAQEAKKRARERGATPLLAAQWERVKETARAIERGMENHSAQPPLFKDGQPEQTLVWQAVGGVFCRAKLDWLRDDRLAIDDLKTTATSADPGAWTRRTLYAIGADVQAAFYLEGLRETTGRDAVFRWVIAETSPPYGLSVVSPGPAVLTIGSKKVQMAREIWRRCLAADEWPGYPSEVCFAELPAWEETRWLEREVAEEERRRT